MWTAAALKHGGNLLLAVVSKWHPMKREEMPWSLGIWLYRRAVSKRNSAQGLACSISTSTKNLLDWFHWTLVKCMLSLEVFLRVAEKPKSHCRTDITFISFSLEETWKKGRSMWKEDIMAYRERNGDDDDYDNNNNNNNNNRW